MVVLAIIIFFNWLNALQSNCYVQLPNTKYFFCSQFVRFKCIPCWLTLIPTLYRSWTCIINSKKFPSSLLSSFKFPQYITKDNIRGLCCINARMEPSFLIIFNQRFCLRVVCTQTLLKSHLVVIRPTDKGFPCNLWNAEREFSCRRLNSFGEPIVKRLASNFPLWPENHTAFCNSHIQSSFLG